MARAVTPRAKLINTGAAWFVALLIFFPIMYTIITSLKTEPEAIAGFNLIPSFTLESYRAVQTQNDYFKPFMNSVILAVAAILYGHDAIAFSNERSASSATLAEASLAPVWNRVEAGSAAAAEAA